MWPVTAFTWSGGKSKRRIFPRPPPHSPLCNIRWQASANQGSSFLAIMRMISSSANQRTVGTSYPCDSRLSIFGQSGPVFTLQPTSSVYPGSRFIQSLVGVVLYEAFRTIQSFRYTICVATRYFYILLFDFVSDNVWSPWLIHVETNWTLVLSGFIEQGRIELTFESRLRVAQWAWLGEVK